ncbi:hypothetical protein [Streptomyces sp. H27-C3]|uniref:hypothetical protein n=1 Tax=Streptomyces sp. H27-C3 TaxID=3046305 RepID=UPI0024BABBAD|nr:hypothetical protein [Streptomyces sp. H27-C3]MDJ0464403.1 hypothetical protein [Streptomyces sp. H27-C3]
MSVEPQQDRPPIEESATEPPSPPAAPVGYSLVIPPGWIRIPLRRKRELEAAVRKLVAEACGRLPAGFPRDRVTPYRLELERRLRKGVAQAKKGAGLDLYLPFEQQSGTLIAASFVVAEISVGDGRSDQAAMLARMSMDGGTGAFSSATVAGSAGSRREIMLPADPNDSAGLATRRVDYAVPVPKDAYRWVTVAFSTVGGGSPDDELADAAVELFDAIMTTFRWSRE